MKKMIIALMLSMMIVSMVTVPVMAKSNSNYVTMFINVSDEGFVVIGGTYHGQPGKQNAVALMVDGKTLWVRPSSDEFVSMKEKIYLPDGRHTLTVIGFEKNRDEWVQQESAKADFMMGKYTTSDEFVVVYRRIGPGGHNSMTYCLLNVPEDSEGNPYADWVFYPGLISLVCSMYGEPQDWRGVEIFRGFKYWGD